MFVLLEDEPDCARTPLQDWIILHKYSEASTSWPGFSLAIDPTFEMMFSMRLKEKLREKSEGKYETYIHFEGVFKVFAS